MSVYRVAMPVVLSGPENWSRQLCRKLLDPGVFMPLGINEAAEDQESVRGVVILRPLRCEVVVTPSNGSHIGGSPVIVVPGHDQALTCAINPRVRRVEVGGGLSSSDLWRAILELADGRVHKYVKEVVLSAPAARTKPTSVV